MTGKTLLDIGCAEGLISILCVERGATLVHGVEVRERAVEVARSLVGFNGMSDRVKFFYGNLQYPEEALGQPGLLPKYDIVLANAVFHKVRKSAELMQKALNMCNETIVIRLPKREVRVKLWKTTDLVDFAARSGFQMEWEACGYPQGEPPYSMEGEAWMGVFRKVS